MQPAADIKVGQALNCIIDDSALLAGLRDPAQDNLKRWIQDGVINLFVPLYTLDKLTQMRSSPPPLNLEARQALEWLDHITNMTASRLAGYVQLQGPDDLYSSWQDVESYMLPDTPLSSHTGPDTLDGINEAFERNLHLRGSTGAQGASQEVESLHTPSTAHSKSRESSPRMTEATPMKNNAKTKAAVATPPMANNSKNRLRKSVGGTANIPASVRPLLNYVVWRTSHQDPAIGGTGRYILLTNDPNTQKQAQKFGVRAKLLSQVSAIMARTERPLLEASAEDSSLEIQDLTTDLVAPDDVADDFEDEVVFQPSQRPRSFASQPGSTLWDPDHFGRAPVEAPPAATTSTTVPTAPAPMPASPRQSPRMPNMQTFGRGNGGPPRGNYGPSPGRGQQVIPHRGAGAARFQYSKPIDPNSYVRPAPNLRRGRGGARKLWDPNT